ncbi:hypothetical protein OG806_47970 [Streptomyces sp. NBC_00882]|uniref:hypothetical protein n=1 Tax=Streptomyces sp. NBC_00882 TaxID=2975856 RepID=UPI00386D545F|nr:hypothetical protein OG806_47970 [Streptomyces sp. NBC_00882]
MTARGSPVRHRPRTSATAPSKATSPPAKRGKTIGGAGVTDEDTLAMALTTGTKKGQHPSPATVMRMLREHDEKATTAASA